MRSSFSMFLPSVSAMMIPFLLSVAVLGPPSHHAAFAHEDSRSQSASLSQEPSGKWSDDTIKCRVCFAGVDRMWEKGAEARKKCEAAYNHETGDAGMGCDRDHVNMAEVASIVSSACDDLHKTHQAEHGGVKDGFRMIRHDSPSHSEDEAAAINESCKKWLFEETRRRRLENFLYQNLENKEHGNDARVAMRKWFCRRACQRGRRGKQPVIPKYNEDL